MKEGAVVAGIGVLLFLATVIDFTSRILSVLSDGVMLAAVGYGVWWLWRDGRQAVARLEAENQAMRAQLGAVGPDQLARAAVQARREAREWLGQQQ